MKRRDFLKAIALSGAAVSIKLNGNMGILAQTVNSSSGKPIDIMAVMGGEPAAMFRKAIAEMGGMEKFIKKGQTVVVKPNIGWDRRPELAANTNPELVGEIVKQCFTAGANDVIVFDHTCDDWIKCYKTSGIEEAAKSANAKVVPADKESYYRTVALPKGKTLTETKIHQSILDCDVWINVPVLKHHGGANLSMSMKNYMGIIWDRRIFHRTDLQQCIADVCTYDKKPVLNIVDAYRIMTTNGPQGRSENDVAVTKGLFISQDIVAVDTAAARFFNQVREMPLDHVKHLANGEKLKVGTMQIEKLNIKRVRM
ncbi:MAG: DUF362 domain-containing protein [Prevotellaceae bacterium]|jgi:uncharacterized protein (DUF362 family)|nr:DUF362 domain-containing protein [Prevotellaceae bacterium]